MSISPSDCLSDLESVDDVLLLLLSVSVKMLCYVEISTVFIIITYQIAY